MQSQTTGACVLPGLETIRIHLGVTQRDLAGMVRSLGGRMAESTVSAIETGARGTSLRNVDLLAQSLACTVDDLFRSPSGQRCSEILAAWHQREADRAREEAGRAS